MKNLILLHGALGSGTQFESWKGHLESDFNVFTPDFEGHGALAPGTREFRIEYFSENIRKLITEKNIEGCCVFGYSMGGYAALNLAIQHPGLIGKIFTFATKFAWNPESSAAEARFLNPEVLLEKVPSYAKALENRHGLAWKDVLTKTAEMMIQLGNAPLLGAEQLAQISIPVQVGVGRQDNMVTFDETAAACQAMPAAKLFVMENTPHPLEKINIEAISGEIKAFFA